METGLEVIYNQEPYVVVFVYNNGWCELKSTKSPYKYELVAQSDLLQNHFG